MSGEGYRIVRLRNGAASVHSTGYEETIHPGLGPVEEAKELYVRQLRLVERLRASARPFVVWDIGLGSGANAVAVVRAAASCEASLRLVSFDQSAGMLEFAVRHAAELGYLDDYVGPLQ